MRRAALLVFAGLLGALLAAPAVESARKPKPRFTVSIEGTQIFEWTLEEGRDSRGVPGPCLYKGKGRQVITFRTGRPVTVLVPSGQGLHATYGGEPFLVAATRKRLISLVGQERREYQVLQRPDPRACPEFHRDPYSRDCSGTNPFLPNASVVLLRYNPTRYNPRRLSRQMAMVYAPVDVLLFDRTPRECNLLLFDLRNYLISQLVTVGQYRALQGGRFENPRTKVVRGTGFARGCVDPFGSSTANAAFQGCSRPPRRPGPLTGEIRADWKLVFRRAR